MINKTLKNGIALLLFCLCVSSYAEVGSVKIISPLDGAKIKNTLKMDFDINPGPKGNHVHMYADGEEVAVIKKLKGQYTFKNLNAGKRELCIKVVDKGHTPIGVEKCIHVTVE